MDLDSNEEHRFKVTQGIQDDLKCYKFEFEVKQKEKNNKQTKISQYFTKK